jgi:hypothetical protein
VEKQLLTLARNPSVNLLRRAGLLGLMMALLVPAAAAPARAAGPEPGIVASIPTGVLSPTELARIHQSGAKTVRFFMYTSSVAPQSFDTVVGQLRAIGVKPLFVVVGQPGNPPVDAAGITAYTNYLRTAAAHFRGQVAGWEIWNEEDASGWWAGALPVDGAVRDASAYTRLLKAAYAAVRSVDPVTPVVMGGTTGNDYRFVQSVYDNGGGGSFDVVAVHTDTACNIVPPSNYYRDPGGAIAQFSFLGYRSVHDVMAAHGDGNKQIWMTEFGWSTTSAICNVGRWAGQKAGGVSLDDQARFTTEAFHCMAEDPYVGKALLFKLTDDAPDTPEARFGMLNVNQTGKPVFSSLYTYAHQGDILGNAPCIDTAGPAINVAKPTKKGRYTKTLTISVSATDSTGVRRITLLYDGANKIRNFTNAAAPVTLSGRITWMGSKKLARGRHTLTIVAVDKEGNTSQVTVTFTKVRAGAAKKVRGKTAAKRHHRKARRHHARRKTHRA